MQAREQGALTTLQQVLRALVGERDTRRAHESLVHGARALCDLPGALTATRHPVTGDLTVESQSGLAVREGGALPAAVRRALEERRVLISDDARLPVPDGEPVRTLTAFPIEHDGRALAVLVVAHPVGRRRLTADEVQLLEILATAGGVTLAHAVATADAARRMATLEEHAATLRRVTAAQRREVLVDRALDAATTLLGADRAAIYFVDDANNMSLMCGRRLSKKYLESVLDTYRLGPGGLLLRTGAPLYVPDLVTDPRSRIIHEAARGEGIHTALFVPFVHDNHIFGAIALYHDIPWRYADEDIALVRAFADQLAASLIESDHRERMMARLERLEMLATLTRGLAAAEPETRMRAGLDALVSAGMPCVWLYRTDDSGRLVRVAQAGASPLDVRLPADAALAALRDGGGVDHAIQGDQRLIAAPLVGGHRQWALVLTPPRPRAVEPRAGTIFVELSGPDRWLGLADFARSCAAVFGLAVSRDGLLAVPLARATTQP